MSIKLIVLLLYFINIFERCYTISYMITERPVVTYFNETILTYAVATSRRVSRRDPRYYVNIYIESTIPADTTIKIDFYFYQFLTNRYRPSFVEFHFGFCDMLVNDPLFGSQFKRSLKNFTCPLPPMQYNFTNMAIPYIPKNFPFQRGRIYLNLTKQERDTKLFIGGGYIDMEIKNFSPRNI